MRTVPLYGKKAAGRVALVDDADYELVSQYRWFILEPEPKPGGRRVGPYAIANSYVAGRHTTIRMHCLIMGIKGVDHRDHDGLNNQRSNLRPATRAQNNQNTRGHGTRRSRYKGVHWDAERGLWRAEIHDGRSRLLGRFVSEEQAAYAYDAAARELFGEYACTNFEDGPTQAMADQWKIQCEERGAAAILNQARSRTSAGWWAQREPVTYTCAECGAEFQSIGLSKNLYCGKRCSMDVENRKRREDRRRAREGALF